jgi:hypothetical protein
MIPDDGIILFNLAAVPLPRLYRLSTRQRIRDGTNSLSYTVDKVSEASYDCSR